MPDLIESFPSEAPTRLLLQNLQRSRKRTRSQQQRQIVRLLHGELSVNDAFRFDALVDDRRGTHDVIQNDCQLFADVLFGRQRKQLRTIGCQEETDRRASIGIGDSARRFQVLSGNHGILLTIRYSSWLCSPRSSRYGRIS